ncbi:hypothetical protein [Mycolicibacterium porcinum]|uniref:hypothetical protein n=1 Tax=Mycolicibacterium porcinum TaxID=39693 RepID=UPI000848DB45|nr:hypothetical protein [Mycolicibacterium porcinum]ODR27021.1 hypothetical protein BHQ19_03715 [Mycolicibacterium porcinum]
MRGEHDRNRSAAVVYRAGPLVWMLTAAAVTSVAGGVLTVVGWARGELTGSLWGPVLGPLFLAAGFGVVAYRVSTTAEPGGEAPDPVDAVVVVRNPLGIVFWLSAALALAVIAMVASGATRFVRRAVRAGGLDMVDVTGLAAVGVTVLIAMTLLATVLVAVAIPMRIIRAHGRTHLWVSREGIGYPPPSDRDSGFRPWGSVTAVRHSSRDVRGVVYTHEWTIQVTDPMSRIVVVYPVGATPRPRAVRRVIEDLAPDVELS